MTPLFMVLLEWARPGGRRPTVLVGVGLLIGLRGVATLVGPASFGGGARVDLHWCRTVILGSLAWSVGSIYSRHAPRPQSAVMMTAIQMLVGGAFVGVIGITRGELAMFDIAAVSARSFAAWVYLLIFGSLIGFTAFVYPAARVDARAGRDVRLREPGRGGDPRLAPGRRGDQCAHARRGGYHCWRRCVDHDRGGPSAAAAEARAAGR